MAFSRQLAEADPTSESDSWPNGELTIRYMSPLFYPQQVMVELAPIAVGRTSYTLGCRIHTGDRYCAVAITRTVRIDNATGKPVPLPDAFASRLSKLLTVL